MSTREDRWTDIDRDVFRTITGADWAAVFARHRAGLVRNAVSDQIVERIKALDPSLRSGRLGPEAHSIFFGRNV